MTTRHAGYIVTLDDDIREDDAEAIIGAIRMIKFVQSVTPIEAGYSDVIARERRDSRWREALIQLAEDGPPGARA
jgi:hypothetical protein